jgi:arsenate reductase (thioredoxin)
LRTLSGRSGASPYQLSEHPPELIVTPPSLKILFLGSGNSARSIFAEYLLRKLGKGKFTPFSAGINPEAQINPYVINVLKELYKVDASDARPKSWDEFKDVSFHFIITSSEHAKGQVPAWTWTGTPIIAHWSTPDPEHFSGSEKDTFNYFWKVSQLIYRRVDLLCNLSFDKLDRLRLEQATRNIATQEGAV